MTPIIFYKDKAIRGSGVGVATGVLVGKSVDDAFDTRSFGTLVAEYDAPSLALADAAAISAWPEKWGNGLDLAQGTAAAKPTYKTAIQNGLAVARFDGGDNVARAATDFSAYTAMTVAVVGKLTNNVSTRSYASFGQRGSEAGSWQLNVSATTGAFNTFAYRSANTQWKASSVGSAWHVVVGRIDFSLASGETLGWVDGDSTGAQTLNGNNSGAFGSSLQLMIGALTGVGENFLGDIGQVIIYGNALTDASVQALTTGLRAKWGI